MIVAVAVALSSVAVVGVSAQAAGTCVPLTGSQYCSQWAANFIPVNATDTPWTDLPSFDNFMASLVYANNAATIAKFQTDYGCTGFTGVGLRDNIGSFCALYVSFGQVNFNCKVNEVNSLCASTVQGTIDSYSALFANTSICQTPTADQQDKRKRTVDAFTTLKGVSHDNSGCFLHDTDANVGESTNCGFGDATFALQFCNSKSPAAPSCCSMVPNFSGTVGSPGPVTAQKTSSAVSSAVPTSQVATTSQPVNLPTTSSSPDPAATSSASSTDQTIFGLSLPIFIGALCGGAVLIIGISLGVCMCVRNNNKKKRSAAAAAAIDAAARRNENKSNNASSNQNSKSNISNHNTSSNGQYDEEAWSAKPSQPSVPQQTQQPPAIRPPQPLSNTGAPVVAAPGENMMQQEELMEAIFNYVPNLSDEIYLYVGDPVVVKCKFDDGWSYGRNNTTGQEGSFPAACVAPYDPNRQQNVTPANEMMDESGADPNRESFTIRQRQSSMFGPPPGFRATMYSEA